MKIIPEQKGSRMSLKETTAFISAIYGENYSTEFDNNCIQKYEVLFENGLPVNVNVIYDKIKVTHSEKSVGYWPIQPFAMELNLKAGLEIIQELK